MSSDRRVHCQVCHRHERDAGPISWRGKCFACGKRRQNENLTAMETKRGPYAAWWAWKLADGVWGAPLDEMPKQP